MLFVRIASPDVSPIRICQVSEYRGMVGRGRLSISQLDSRETCAQLSPALLKQASLRDQGDVFIAVRPGTEARRAS